MDPDHILFATLVEQGSREGADDIACDAIQAHRPSQSAPGRPAAVDAFVGYLKKMFETMDLRERTGVTIAECAA